LIDLVIYLNGGLAQPTTKLLAVPVILLILRDPIWKETD
jgi:hypothetical protein